MEQAVQTEELRPPITSIGPIGWVKNNLFNGVFNSILTIVTLFFLWKVVPPFFRWAFIDSAWHTTGQACRQAAGACWSIISMNYRFILFGFYPYEQQWRPFLAMMILFGLLFYSRDRNHWKKPLAYAWIIGLFTMGLLMKGGLFGLKPVESTQWGGLPLTLLLAVFGLTAAYPLGVILALGRRSKMPGVKVLCILVYRVDPRRTPDQPPLYVRHHFPSLPAGRGHLQQDPPGAGGDHPFHRCIYCGGGQGRVAGYVPRAV